jgi:hypothetical protein
MQLENLRHESEVAAKYVYAEMALNHGASTSRKLLARLNDHPTFWSTCMASLQSSAYISLARVFDNTSKFNVGAFLSSMKAPGVFGPDSLTRIKLAQQDTAPNWLSSYIRDAYYPTPRMMASISARVDKHRTIFDRAIKPARNKYLAHREKWEAESVKNLFAQGTVDDLWQISTFLLQLHEQTWQMYVNGSRPAFRNIRRSIRTIYQSPSKSTLPHERIVREVKSLFEKLAS